MSIVFRPVNINDVSILSSLMIKYKQKFLGMCDYYVCKTFIEDAVNGKDIFIMVAVENDNIIGWIISFINYKKYLIYYLIRHPAVAAKFFISKFKRKNMPARTDCNSKGFSYDENIHDEWKRHCDRSWGLSRKHIAKSINITIVKGYRRMGIGHKLSISHKNELYKRGVTQVDGYILITNRPSIKYHQKMGWSLVKVEGNSCLMTLDLPIEGQLNEKV